MDSRKAVGSLIGIGFLLMIIAVGISYWQLQIGVARQSDAIIQEMSNFDMSSADENLDIQYVDLTVGNSLNLTIKNTGAISSQLEWVWIYDSTHNKEAYYRVDEGLSPLEIVKDIGNTSIVMNPADEYTISVLTRLGNSYYAEYPTPSIGDGGNGGGATGTSQYYTDYTQVDNHPDTEVGVHSFFAAMKGQPDGVMNILIEDLPPVQAPVINVLINYESFEGAYPPVNWDENPPGNRWAPEGDQAYDGALSADFDGQANGRSGELISPPFDTSDASSITLDFWYRDENLDTDEFILEYWDGANWDYIEMLSDDPEDTWNNYHEEITDPQYFITDFMVRWRAEDVEGGKSAYFDYVYLDKVAGVASTDYELDLEVGWTGLSQATYEYLSVYGGTQAAESLLVEVWDGGQYVTLISDVQPGWNSVDVSAYHTGSTFNIRFKDATQTSDPNQNSWEIDTLYLNLWD